MKEFSFRLEEGIKRGLRRDYRGARNSGELIALKNLKCKEYGIVPYEPVTLPFDITVLSAYGIELNWPRPQLFRGMGRTILADYDAIYYVNEDTWTLIPLDLYSAVTPSQTASLQPGGLWQMVDVFDTWMLHNGVCSVFHSNRHIMLGEVDKVYVQTATRIEAGCYHKGRAYLGGFDPEHFHTPAWKSFWEDWAARQSHGISLVEEIGAGDVTAPVRPNMVWWSSIGGGDLLWLFHQDLALSGLVSSTYGSANPLHFDYMRRNEAGYMAMPWQGKVRQMLPLGDAVVVYGDGGVTALKPSGAIVGMQEISTVGVNNAGAAGGDSTRHVYVDQEGAVWGVDTSLKATRLGYVEFFSGMLYSPIVVSYNQKDKEFTLSNGYQTYVLTEQGLSQVTQVVTSQVLSGGRMVGIAEPAEYLDDREALLVTDIFDFGMGGPVDHRSRGFTTLEWVEIGGRPNTPTWISVDYRYTKDEDFSSSPWVPVNDNGVARIAVTALEFRVRVKCTDFEDVEFDYINVRYKASDRRFTRGIQVGTV